MEDDSTADSQQKIWRLRLAISRKQWHTLIPQLGEDTTKLFVLVETCSNLQRSSNNLMCSTSARDAGSIQVSANKLKPGMARHLLSLLTGGPSDIGCALGE